MIYLLDANVLMDANRDFYSFDMVPEFWPWLHHLGEQGVVKMPLEVYEEVKAGKDGLAEWAKEPEIEAALLFDEDVNIDLVQTVITDGYAPNLSDIEVEQVGRDPFLIAYALADSDNRCIVTTEVSKPRRQRANRHVPDVCNDFAIQTRNAFQFIRELGFTTKWNQ